MATKKSKKPQATPPNAGKLVAPLEQKSALRPYSPPTLTDGQKIVTPSGVSVAGQPASTLPGGERMMDLGMDPNQPPTAASLIRPGEDLRVPIKTGTDISQQRVMQYLLARFNPIRGLTPRLLATYLEQHDLGFIRWMALVFNKIRERDDAISAAMIAREAKPADMGWEIVVEDESDEATAHKAALEYFYKNLSVTQCLDQNQRGGVSLMIRQMMRAVGDKFAVHEVVWVPGPNGLSAEVRFVPLWFFENRTGQLRFLPYELALQGVPIEPGGWMVHMAEGLFPSLSILYLYKQMGLKGWVAYMDKFAIPFLHAKTMADYESTEWNSLVSAMQNFASDGGIVTKSTTELNPIVMGSQGEAPHAPFCDRMDRAIARVVRGGDLSSMSKGGGGSSGSGGGVVGANPQMDNETMLAKADAERISETCQFYLDRWVINYKFGEGVQPKARFVIQPPQEIDVQREILVDQFLLSIGFPMALSELGQRYERQMADPSETIAQAPAPKPAFGQPGAGDAAGDQTDGQMDKPENNGQPPALGNVAPVTRRFYTNANKLRAEAQAKALAPLKGMLETAVAVQDPDERKTKLESIRLALPKMLHGSVTPKVIEVFDSALSAAMVNGALSGAQATHHAGRSVNVIDGGAFDFVRDRAGRVSGFRVKPQDNVEKAE